MEALKKAVWTLIISEAPVVKELDHLSCQLGDLVQLL